MIDSQDLRLALEAARRASARIMQDYAVRDTVHDAPVSVSTETDKASQEIIIEYLKSACPEDGFCAEESAETRGTSAAVNGRVWIIDPIDGTRGFVTKNGEFSVMIALMVHGELQVGVVAEPALDCVTFAVKGHGSWVTRGGETSRCLVTDNSVISELVLVMSHVKDKPKSRELNAVAPKQLRETYSAGVKLAMVARGEVDAYLNTYGTFYDWDIAAGHLLVTEAGGEVRTMLGETVLYQQAEAKQTAGLLATNGRVTAAITARLKNL